MQFDKGQINFSSRDQSQLMGLQSLHLKFTAQALHQHQNRYKISYTNPASVQIAQKHQKAVKFGYRRPINDPKQLENQKLYICGCCNFNSHVKNIPLCTKIQPPTDKKPGFQYMLTEDVALYFTFLKSLIYLIIIHSIIYSMYNMMSSKTYGHFCQSLETCQFEVWNQTSAANKINFQNQKLLFILDILNLLCVVLTIFFFGWNRRHLYNISKIIDNQCDSQGDFTLLVSNIPNMQYPPQGQNINQLESKRRQKLKHFFKKKILKGFNQKSIDQQKYIKLLNQYALYNQYEEKASIIPSISLCYNLAQLQVLQNYKSNIINEFQYKFILFDKFGIKIPDLCGFKNRQKDVILQHNNSLVDNYPFQIEPQYILKTIYKNQVEEKQQYKMEKCQQILKCKLNQIPFDYQTISFFEDARRKVKFINESEIILMKQFTQNKRLLFHNTTFTGHALISFQYQDYKEYIQMKFHRNPSQFIFQGNQLKIQDACQPTDVFWNNMKITQGQRTKKIIFSIIVLVLLLMFSFIVVFIVQIIKRNYIKSQQEGILSVAKSKGLSFLTSLIIIGVNKLFDFISQFLTNLQGHTTKTNYMFSNMLKSFFSRLINTIMMTFLIALILTHDYQQNRFMGPTGLVSQIYNYFFVSGIKDVALSFINIDQLLARFKRCYLYYYRNNKNNNKDEVQSKFQISLNKQFQLPDFGMTNRYCDYLVTLYTALFYAYLVPIIIPVLIIIFFLQYWIDKFTLFKRSSLKNHFNFNLSIYISKLFQSSILIFSLGNIIFSYLLQQVQDENYNLKTPRNSKMINFIALLLSILYTLSIWLAPPCIEQKLFGNPKTQDEESYYKCVVENKFKTTYWNQNPATFIIDQKLQNTYLSKNKKKSFDHHQLLNTSRYSRRKTERVNNSKIDFSNINNYGYRQ